MKLKSIILSLALLCFTGVFAKDYNASIFGIKSNGTTLNTTSIQKAIDLIHEEGGGHLNFYVGRYLTGTIELKSDVHIILHEGAILVGSTNIYDYNIETPNTALVYAKNADNISITGLGVIDGQGRDVAYSLLDQVHKGIINDQLKYDRPANRRPKGIYFRECRNVEISGITIKNTAEWVQVYDQCENLKIDKITVDSKAFWNNDGLDIVDCKDVLLTNSFIDSSDDAICFKSHDATKMCENVEVRNCVARSSASGIKFGTVTRGGYKNFKIINNKVYDTYRSAIAIQTPDGGVIENILIDSLNVYNTGNAIFLRIGERWAKNGVGSMNNITIQNVYAEIPATKPDAGYPYEGPIEDLPRNISPASIVGLPGHDITNVTLRNIEIVYPGGSNKTYAYRGIKPADLDGIPEMPDRYPEYSQWKELPAWGFYVRHAKNLTFENVTLTAKEKEYRPAIVFDDVKGATLKDMEYNFPGSGKKLFKYKSTEIIQK
ncbi:Glycosyl hydrolases family 28 [Tangfeifania diversioriginum]|uniref:Glycosyl hydrolases family 28 n=1 Tax=Tangfeifania diversioriginum TaxID=1168035 RepID=A0A1M6J919_9BACT|nr:glycosyl hydrolase family 28 protein [Tangfeifania diversioriginum]SHJ43216.1 Glycosyl hydrolases family 28 [Tangfeifania diversioriginum]